MYLTKWQIQSVLSQSKFKDVLQKAIKGPSKCMDTWEMCESHYIRYITPNGIYVEET